MSVRGEPQRAMIRAVVDAFGERADELVFIGGCVLALYAGDSVAPLRPTTDVDCLSGMRPWSRQEAMLAELCHKRLLVPDNAMQFRYRIEGMSFDVDVLSPDGANVPASPWFRRTMGGWMGVSHPSG